MSPLVLCLLLASLASAVPRKDCNLVRSKTDIGQCFKEPECEQKCQTRSETMSHTLGVKRLSFYLHQLNRVLDFWLCTLNLKYWFFNGWHGTKYKENIQFEISVIEMYLSSLLYGDLEVKHPAISTHSFGQIYHLIS